MNALKYDSDEDLALNHDEQEYDGDDDDFDPRECDRAAEMWERQFLDNFYYKA